MNIAAIAWSESLYAIILSTVLPQLGITLFYKNIINKAVNNTPVSIFLVIKPFEWWYTLQVPPISLFPFNGFKQGFKITLAEAFGAFTLDNLKKQGGSVFHGFGKYLQQIPFLITVNKNAQSF